MTSSRPELALKVWVKEEDMEWDIDCDFGVEREEVEGREGVEGGKGTVGERFPVESGGGEGGWGSWRERREEKYEAECKLGVEN